MRHFTVVINRNHILTALRHHVGMQWFDCHHSGKCPCSESEEPQQLIFDHDRVSRSKCIILTDFQIALANTSQPRFIRMAGAAKMINVGAIGKTVTINVTMKIMTIIIVKVAAVLALVSFRFSANFTCSMVYP